MFMLLLAAALGWAPVLIHGRPASGTLVARYRNLVGGRCIVSWSQILIPVMKKWVT